MSTPEFSKSKDLISLTPAVKDIACDELGARPVLLLVLRRRRPAIAAGRGSEDSKEAAPHSKMAQQMHEPAGVPKIVILSRANSVMIYLCGPDLLLLPAAQWRCRHRRLHLHRGRVSLRQPACAHRPCQVLYSYEAATTYPLRYLWGGGHKMAKPLIDIPPMSFEGYHMILAAAPNPP